MPDARRAGEPQQIAAALGRLRRARLGLWLASCASVVWGVASYEGGPRALSTRAFWLAASAAALAWPLSVLFGFRCPRCNAHYLAGGRWRDFFGISLLWANRCGSCSLPASDDGPPSSGALHESGPA